VSGVRQAVVLVGGEGRRLRPLTDTRPKPMVPLLDRPFVEHQLDHLRRSGVREIVFSCGYRPDALEAHFGDGARLGMRIGYVVDPEPLGTAGAVRNAEPLLHGGDVLVLNGDILTDLDLAALTARHGATGAEATIVLTPVEDPSAFGLVRLRAGGQVEAFLEKPTPDQLRPGEPFLINAGTYVLGERARGLIPDGVACSIERDIFPGLADRGVLHGHSDDAYWRDIGTPLAYLQATADALAGRLRTIPATGGAHVCADAQVDADAEVDGASVVGPRVRVGAGARIAGSVLLEGARVGADATLDGVVLGAGAEVGAGARLDGAAGPLVVGDGARIAPGAVLVGPGTVPTGGAVAVGEGLAPAR
jgi:mannose-1-phosphate guanylyltransferase